MVPIALLPSIAHLVHDYGLALVAGVIGLEGVGSPLPWRDGAHSGFDPGCHPPRSEHRCGRRDGRDSGVVGQVIGYLIGREFGYWLLLRYGCYLRITESRIKLGEYLFLRHGGKIIIIARFVPVLRSLAGVLAGANRMPWRQFLLTNVAGAVLWSSFFGFAAYMLGRQLERFTGPMVILIGIIAVIAVVVGAIFVGRHEAQLTAKAERALPGPLK